MHFLAIKPKSFSVTPLIDKPHNSKDHSCLQHKMLDELLYVLNFNIYCQLISTNFISAVLHFESLKSTAIKPLCSFWKKMFLVNSRIKSLVHNDSFKSFSTQGRCAHSHWAFFNSSANSLAHLCQRDNDPSGKHFDSLSISSKQQQPINREVLLNQPRRGKLRVNEKVNSNTLGLSATAISHSMFTLQYVTTASVVHLRKSFSRLISY